MESLFTYSTEDQLLYNFNFQIIEDSQIKVTIQKIYKDNTILNLPYVSIYSLNYLNERLEKFIHFNKITDFRECLISNISKKTLFIKPPYKNAIVTIWKIFPNEPTKKNTFTLLSSNNYDKGLSLIFFGENTFSEDIQKEIENSIQQNNPNINFEKDFKELIYNNRLINNMIFLPIKNISEDEIITYFSEIIKLKKNDSGKILILFEEENLAGIIKKLFDKFFKDPFFIIIFTKRKENELKKEINYKLKNLSNIKKPYIDIDNIYIYENKSENYKKILIPILKIFSYYNQLGDGFFKEIKDMNLPIEGLNEEFSHLFLSHYFNILVCGGTGVGKSTFINKIMGEKKAFTLKSISAATYRNNYYCHKKYPIKIIDVCGFAEGNEGKDNLESIKSIYNKNLDNIVIDQSTSDIFDFYEDKRNNIHLLLYFNIYDGKLDVIPGELPVILEAIEKKIPIFFILNKCPDEVFEEDNEEFIEDLQGTINHARENTLYSNFKTYFINCLNLKGFDKLLKGINAQFSEYIIKEKDLESLKNATIEENHFKEIFKNSFFFGGIEPQYYLLNNSLIESINDIKKLVIELGSFYTDNLNIFQSIGFYLFSKLYNNICRNSQTNFFPLLTDLVKKIYTNFNITDRNKEQCNDFIRLKISQYFGIDMKIDTSKFSHYELELADDNKESTMGDAPPPKPKYVKVFKEHQVEIPYSFNINKFKKDYTNLGKLFWNSRPNFHSENRDKIEEIDRLGESIFSNIEDISPKRLYQLIERDFGKDDSSRDATKSEKIIIKLFYISYTCNELISSILWKINQEGFNYKSICSFYYNISISYNNAINGFCKIWEDMENSEEKNIAKSKD